ncbi:MAG: polysaccharide deacetylase family protein [Planctomycetaceae bacterium]
MSVERSLPRLVVTVDTEEEGLWGGRFRAVGNTTQNLRSLPRFQELCDRFDVRPTYLIDAPVVDDAWAVERLGAWQNDDRCEVGAHCHPWCNPPLNGDADERSSYLCNLSEELQRGKLEWLTETIEARLGRRPTSFRAGRYGLDGLGAMILADLGYLVDSSVIPFTNYSSNGGPNFDGAPAVPYWIGDDLRRPAATGRLREVPVTVGYSRCNFEAAHSLRTRAGKRPWSRLRSVGILDRIGIARRIKLSPEQAAVRDLNRLAGNCIARGAPCLVLMFHSSSLMAGGSTYVRDVEALERFYARLEGVFRYCRERWKLGSATLSECVPSPTQPVSVSTEMLFRGG